MMSNTGNYFCLANPLFVVYSGEVLVRKHMSLVVVWKLGSANKNLADLFNVINHIVGEVCVVNWDEGRAPCALP